jgi:Polysaccharide biosynthesis protein
MVAGTYAFYITWVVCLWMITSWRPGRGHVSLAMWRELARFGAPLFLAITGWRLRTAVGTLVVGRVLSTSALGFFRYGQRIAQIPQVGIVEVGTTTLFPAFSRIAGDRERLAAAQARLEDLDYGDIDGIEAAVRHYPLAGAKKDEVEKELGYFLNNAPRMRYRWFRSRGLFVGSGVVESGCKAVIGQRLKMSGMRWALPGADAIATLRCQHASRPEDRIWRPRNNQMLPA